MIRTDFPDRWAEMRTDFPVENPCNPHLKCGKPDHLVSSTMRTDFPDTIASLHGIRTRL